MSVSQRDERNPLTMTELLLDQQLSSPDLGVVAGENDLARTLLNC